MLEASAGTGKTFALAGLVTRYVAEGVATLDQMLLITFSRAASQELRERVRDQILDAVAAFDDPSTRRRNELVGHLLDGTDRRNCADRERRLRDALAGFDAATIATTHQFCQLVLQSLGVAGDTDAGVRWWRASTTWSTEIVDDLYLAHFGQERDDPPLSRDDALTLARAVVGEPVRRIAARRPAAGHRCRGPASSSRQTVCSANWSAANARLRHPALRRPAEPAREALEADGLSGPRYACIGGGRS